MDRNLIALGIICTGIVLLAGCTTSSPPSLNGTTITSAPILAVTTIPGDNQTCTMYADCVPAQCCHPASCVNHQEAIHVCNLLCTASCEGPLDCGAGSCGCVNGRCSVVPATSTTKIPRTSLQLTASPERYSPLMSSTVGIGIEANASGFDPAKSLFTWDATYGYFLSWGTADFTVQERGNPVTNHGEKLYWSFIEKPASTLEPVIVTVTATDPTTNKVLGSSTITLGWDGELAVVVKEIR
jgi:hypothetical protein